MFLHIAAATLTTTPDTTFLAKSLYDTVTCKTQIAAETVQAKVSQLTYPPSLAEPFAKMLQTFNDTGSFAPILIPNATDENEEDRLTIASLNESFRVITDLLNMLPKSNFKNSLVKSLCITDSGNSGYIAWVWSTYWLVDATRGASAPTNVIEVLQQTIRRHESGNYLYPFVEALTIVPPTKTAIIKQAELLELELKLTLAEGENRPCTLKILTTEGVQSYPLTLQGPIATEEATLTALHTFQKAYFERNLHAIDQSDGVESDADKIMVALDKASLNGKQVNPALVFALKSLLFSDSSSTAVLTNYLNSLKSTKLTTEEISLLETVLKRDSEGNIENSFVSRLFTLPTDAKSVHPIQSQLLNAELYLQWFYKSDIFAGMAKQKEMGLVTWARFKFDELTTLPNASADTLKEIADTVAPVTTEATVGEESNKNKLEKVD